MQLISIGYPQTLTQNVIYALPVSRCLLFVATPGVALEQSNTATMMETNPLFPPAPADVNITLVDGQSEVAGGFIRSTAADCIVTLKKF